VWGCVCVCVWVCVCVGVSVGRFVVEWSEPGGFRHELMAVWRMDL
jgi:hypothetical protein